jgi:very-short-patch-repair endonuclease
MGRENDNRGRFDRPRVAWAARSKHWVLSTAELHDLRLTERQIRHAADTGFLHPKHHGVYAVGRPELSFEGRCRAAWLACGGEGCAVSHVSALADHNLRRPYGKVHVSGPRSLEGHPDIYVHRPRSLPPEDIFERDGYAVTTVARTILDTAPTYTVDTIGRWIHEAKVQGIFDPQQMWACLERRPGQRGRKKVEAALAREFVYGRTELENSMWRIWRRAEMPAAVANAYVWTEMGPEEVDLLCASLGLVVEVDGDVVHGTRWRQRRDAAKDVRVEATGLKVLRLPELRITLDQSGVEAEFRSLAATRGPGNRPLMSISPPTA